MSVTKISFKKQLANLEKALHLHEAHPHFECYHVKVGKDKTRFDLHGKKPLEWPKGTPVKVGVWHVEHYGMRKEVYAYRTTAALGYIFEADADHALFDLLIERAHKLKIAPGYQYGHITISLTSQTFTAPMPHLTQGGWSVLDYRVTDTSLHVEMLRPDLSRKVWPWHNEVRNHVEFDLREKVRKWKDGGPEITKVPAPITFCLEANADNKDFAHRGMSGLCGAKLIPFTPATPLTEPHWHISPKCMRIYLRLPQKK
jgi:hypothetical protein